MASNCFNIINMLSTQFDLIYTCSQKKIHEFLNKKNSQNILYKTPPTPIIFNWKQFQKKSTEYEMSLASINVDISQKRIQVGCVVFSYTIFVCLLYLLYIIYFDWFCVNILFIQYNTIHSIHTTSIICLICLCFFFCTHFCQIW